MPQVSEKTNKLIEAYGIYLFQSNHPTIKDLEHSYAPSVHGNKTWDSSFLIMDYLLHKHILKPNLSIMELGCGWGPAAIFCAENAGAKVTGVDLDADVFPFMQAQAELNNVSIRPLQRSFEAISQEDLNGTKLMLGADICFWEEFSQTHYKLITKALNAGVTDIIFADPGRSPFYDLVEKCSRDFTVDCLEWYATEPKRFEGIILHIKA